MYALKETQGDAKVERGGVPSSLSYLVEIAGAALAFCVVPQRYVTKLCLQEEQEKFI